MAQFVSHAPCPRCGSRDNLGRYSDGSGWCFGCHLFIPAHDSGGIHNQPAAVALSGVDYDIQLPDDLSFDYPGHVVSWLAKYHITVPDAIRHGWKYSQHYDQLTFIFKDEEGKIACTQARNFNKERASKRKYYNQGSPREVLPIYRGTNLVDPQQNSTQLGPSRLVVVEDAVSAARIASARGLGGPTSDAMPCLGSYLPLKKLSALKGLNYESLVVWLDSDKLKEAREIAQQAKWLGFDSRVVYTELDPKCYTDTEIQSILACGKNTT